MAVHIRLSRAGRKGVPVYRLVAVDSRVKRDGKVLANLGTYDALNGRVIQFHDDLLNSWVQKGALLTDSAKKVHKLFKKNGIYIAPAKKVSHSRVVSAITEEAQIAE